MKKHIFFASVFVSLALLLIGSFMADEADGSVSKKITFEIAKDYEACEFKITTEKEGDFDVTLHPQNSTETYTGSMEDTNVCTVSVENVKAGRWDVTVTQRVTGETSAENRQEDTEEETDASADAEAEPEAQAEPVDAEELIGKIQVTAKAIDKTAFSIGNVQIARDIVGLQLYFKDDSIVVEWTDTSCGNVKVSVIDSYTDQILDTKTVTDRYYEFLIPELVTEITVDIVPATSSNITGANSRFNIPVVNEPDAVVTYGDKEYVNTDTIPVTVNLSDSYSLLFLVNGEEVKETGILASGEYVYDVPVTEGTNEVLTYVVDADHNMRSTSYTVIRDSIKPALTLDMEYDGITTYDDTITITGTIRDYDTFMINETEPVVAGDGSFKSEYILRDGENVLNVRAADIAGNETLYTAVVTKAVRETTIWDYAWPVGVGLVLIIGIAIRLWRKKKGGSEKREDKPQKPKKEKKDNKEPAQAREKRALKSRVVPLLIGIACCVCSYLFFTRIIMGGWVPSSSMEPTLMVGDYAISNGLAYLNREPQRGDVVVFRHAGAADGKTLIKRIVGIPGDSIMFIDGYVYINGEPVYESYLPQDTETNSFKDFEDIPEGCYFVMGDNRENSEDSRFWDDPYVKRKDIRGKLLSIIPLARLKETVREIFM